MDKKMEISNNKNATDNRGEYPSVHAIAYMDTKNRRITDIGIRKKSAFANLMSGAVKNQKKRLKIKGSGMAHSTDRSFLPFLKTDMVTVMTLTTMNNEHG